jgi:hypothetical protein
MQMKPARRGAALDEGLTHLTEQIAANATPNSNDMTNPIGDRPEPGGEL